MGRVFDLEVEGQPVTVKAERDDDRMVYLVTWNPSDVVDSYMPESPSSEISDRCDSDQSECVWQSPRSAARRPSRGAGG